VPDVDFTAAGVIRDFQDDLGQRHVALWFAVLNRTPRDAARRTGSWQRATEEDRLYPSVNEAVTRYRALGGAVS
jgi:hypothetical protein